MTKDELSVFQSQPQIKFKIGGGDATYIDDSDPNVVVVRKRKNDQMVLMVPASVAHEFGYKPKK